MFSFVWKFTFMCIIVANLINIPQNRIFKSGFIFALLVFWFLGWINFRAWTYFRGRPIRPDFAGINFRGWYRFLSFRVDKFSWMGKFSFLNIHSHGHSLKLRDPFLFSFAWKFTFMCIIIANLINITQNRIFKTGFIFAVLVFWFLGWINFRGWVWIVIFRVDQFSRKKEKSARSAKINLRENKST